MVKERVDDVAMPVVLVGGTVMFLYGVMEVDLLAGLAGFAALLSFFDWAWS